MRPRISVTGSVRPSVHWSVGRRRFRRKQGQQTKVACAQLIQNLLKVKLLSELSEPVSIEVIEINQKL